MPEPVSSLADVPLETLLPDNQAVVPELRRLGAPLDSRGIRWHWLPENVQRPAADADSYLFVLGGSISLFSTGVDWLSAELDVGWDPRRVVRASVEVACWCPVNHNAHDFQVAWWAAETDAALVEGFTGAVTMLTRFLDSGRDDPDQLRTAAGLPNP